MGAKVTTKNVKIVGKTEYIRKNTGEVEEMQVISVEERDFNFHKFWLRNILTTVDLISNKKNEIGFLDYRTSRLRK